MNEHAEKHEGTTPRNRERGLLLLRAGDCVFAVYAEECECVTPWTEPAPLPHAPGTVLGVVSVRGRIRTVLDPTRLLGSSARSHEERPALVVSLIGDEQLALACDASAPSTLNADAQLSSPASAAHSLRGTFQRDGETVHLLDPARLFDAAMSGTERRRQRSVKRES